MDSPAIGQGRVLVAIERLGAVGAAARRRNAPGVIPGRLRSERLIGLGLD